MRLPVTALTRYSRSGASSRVRVLQYVPTLRSLGVDVEVRALLGDEYLRTRFTGGRSNLRTALAYANRIRDLWSAGPGLIWLEKEALPYVPAAIELRSLSRFVMDIDDAWYLSYALHPSPVVRSVLARKIEALMRRARLVVAGNQYLAEYASSLGARTRVIPSVVDTTRYQVSPHRLDRRRLVLGWIGTPSTVKYLEGLRPTLERLAMDTPLELRVIGAPFAPSNRFPVRCIEWSEAGENIELNQLDVGLMPLDDSPWERGKCAYKLIQYMATGRPVVGSPVGANCEVVRAGIDGFLPRTSDEWVDSVRQLLDPELRARMGASGRQRVVEHYSLQSQSPHLAELLRLAAADA